MSSTHESVNTGFRECRFQFSPGRQFSLASFFLGLLLFLTLLSFEFRFRFLLLFRFLGFYLGSQNYFTHDREYMVVDNLQK